MGEAAKGYLRRRELETALLDALAEKKATWSEALDALENVTALIMQEVLILLGWDEDNAQLTANELSYRVYTVAHAIADVERNQGVLDNPVRWERKVE